MTALLLPRIDQTHDAANASGALQPIRTEREIMQDGGIDFTIRWVSSLERKDSDRLSAALRRDPDFDPFLPPDPDLTVGPLGDKHLAVLNKFPVIARHLLIVTRDFVSQTLPLDVADFTALAQVMSELGGLGFYNGGTEAGASQRHKHLQWIPEAARGAKLSAFTHGLPEELPPGSTTVRDDLPWRHCFARLPTAVGSNAEDLGIAFHTAFVRACDALGLPSARDPMPPYNLLTGNGWLVVIPRSREHCEKISVNALGFAGGLFVPRPELIDTIRTIGPLKLLTSVGLAR
ncbi:ATP adenylyltransferase family protein [Aromatoleum sp.]|uniref:ATP adenylyltransferase family protein n=1 Tax=Aromatoleum sp. TaxID=2307007 RepID=UPI002FC637A5